MKARVASLLSAFAALCMVATASAEELDYRLAPRQIAEGTWVVIGKTEDFTRKNGGNIVNTAFVVTDDGVVVIDSGPSRRYGEQLRSAIAAISSKPIVRVFNTHHHPDHYLGNQAFQNLPIVATTTTIQGQRSEGAGFVDNVFRLSGDWIKGTESTPASVPLAPGITRIGNHEFELISLAGHTASDLVILDKTTGVLFTGDLVFFNRAPTTPHATLSEWYAALARLEAIPHRILVPGHGEPANDDRAIDQTRRYLQWVEASIRDAAERGEEMDEVLRKPLPPEFAAIPLSQTEFARSVAHLFRRYEKEALQHKH